MLRNGAEPRSRTCKSNLDMRSKVQGPGVRCSRLGFRPACVSTVIAAGASPVRALPPAGGHMAFVLPLPASVIAEVNELRSWTLWQSRAARRGTPSASAMQGWWGTLPPDLRDVAEDVLTAAGV